MSKNNKSFKDDDLLDFCLLIGCISTLIVFFYSGIGA